MTAAFHFRADLALIEIVKSNRSEEFSCSKDRTNHLFNFSGNRHNIRVQLDIWSEFKTQNSLTIGFPRGRGPSDPSRDFFDTKTARSSKN